MSYRALRLPLLVAGVAVIAIGALFLAFSVGHDRTVSQARPSDPDAVLTELRVGNARFVASRRTLTSDTKSDADLRHRLVNGQHPFAAVLCCSDSRLCPAFIFDQPPGGIFEIRNAGNAVEDDAMASFEYAVEHLQIRFLLVLGHKGCGAVEAVVDAGDKPLHDHLRDLQQRMKRAHAQAVTAHGKPTADYLNGLSKENALEQATTLVKESKPVGTAVRRREVRLLAGMYDMESGAVVYYDLP